MHTQQTIDQIVSYTKQLISIANIFDVCNETGYWTEEAIALKQFVNLKKVYEDLHKYNNVLKEKLYLIEDQEMKVLLERLSNN